MNKPTSDNSVYDITIRLLILLGIVVWCLLIMYPFASIILWSIILVIALTPLHKKLSGKKGTRKKTASIIIVISVLILIVIPTGIIIDEVINEIKILKVSYDDGTLKIPPPSESVKEWPVIGEKLHDLWNTASSNFQQLIIKYQDQILDFGKTTAGGIFNAASGVIQIIISLLIAGILLAKGGVNESIRTFFRKAIGKMGDEIADITFKTVGSVVKGVIGEALVLAIMNGIIFFIAGVPYAGIWTILVFILAVLQLPVFIVTLPIMIYFFSVKELLPAILWTVSLLLVSFSDNFLTPLMLGKNAPVPMIVIFLGVIGGCILSGFIGLFTGAIILSVGYTLLIKWIRPDTNEFAE